MALINSSSWVLLAIAAAIIAVVFQFVSNKSSITRDGKPLR